MFSFLTLLSQRFDESCDSANFVYPASDLVKRWQRVNSVTFFSTFSPQHQGCPSLDLGHKHTGDLTEMSYSQPPHSTNSLPSNNRLGSYRPQKHSGTVDIGFISLKKGGWEAFWISCSQKLQVFCTLLKTRSCRLEIYCLWIKTHSVDVVKGFSQRTNPCFGNLSSSKY